MEVQSSIESLSQLSFTLLSLLLHLLLHLGFALRFIVTLKLAS